MPQTVIADLRDSGGRADLFDVPQHGIGCDGDDRAGFVWLGIQQIVKPRDHDRDRPGAALVFVGLLLYERTVFVLDGRAADVEEVFFRSTSDQSRPSTSDRRRP